MKTHYDKAIVSVFYLLGLNVYYLLWYLVSDGQALIWSQVGLTFWSHALAANASALINVFVILAFINRLNVKAEPINSPQNIYAIFLISFCVFGFSFSIISGVQSLLVDAKGFRSFLSSRVYASIHFYHLVVGSLMTLLHLAILKAGGNVKVFFAGLIETKKKSYPVNRGFAFIDMNSSTAIVERLGPEQFSRLIGQCFKLLNKTLEDYPSFEIYQYVGDEAIITWEVDKPVAADAMKIFSQFSAALRNQEKWFKNNFGLMPKFKCAIHVGEVVETEIEGKNQHKAYHGDVLNMTSRILDLCHKYDTSLLISQAYQRLISIDKEPDLTSIKHDFVNGKTRTFTLYKPIKLKISLLEKTRN